MKDDHEKLRQIMQEFADLMAQPVPDMALIARRRIAFSQLFQQHLQRENAELRALQQSDASSMTNAVTRTHADAMRALFLQYSSHIKAWAPANMAADWTAYRKAVLELQRQLRERMAWEEKFLHPLFGQSRQAA